MSTFGGKAGIAGSPSACRVHSCGKWTQWTKVQLQQT